MKLRVLPTLISSCLLAFTYSYAEAPPIPICKTRSNSISSSTVMAIPSPGTVQSTIVVSGAFPALWDVDVTTFIRHINPGDLDITVRSPEGTIVTLTTDNASGADNVFNGTLWDDSADIGGTGNRVVDNVYTDNVVASHLTPEEGLIAFHGENPNGVWALTVHDDSASISGTLDGWGLNITSIPFLPLAGTAGSTGSLSQPINVGAGFSTLLVDFNLGPICGISVILGVTHLDPADLDISLTSPSGKNFTLTTDNGSNFDNVFLQTTFAPTADLGSQVPYNENPTGPIGIVTDRAYSNNPGPLVLTPEESLGAIYGEDGSGTWGLSYRDDTPGNFDAGVLNSIGIFATLCAAPQGDSDGDQSDNVCDECPQDFNKVLAGVCGCNVPETDSDSDGTPDCTDGCDTDPAKVASGMCGCGVADSDSDGDGTADCLDQCQTDSTKTSPGVCGCGVADSDSDGDGTADCFDQCQTDSAKTSPGVCGCEVADSDSDGDGTANCLDQCQTDSAKTSPGVCGCGAADADLNANSVIDCLFKDELRARLLSIQILAKQLKLKNGTFTKKSRAAKRALKPARTDLNTYVGTFNASISLSNSSANLVDLNAGIQRALKEAAKGNASTFKKDRSKALKSLAALIGLL